MKRIKSWRHFAVLAETRRLARTPRGAGLFAFVHYVERRRLDVWVCPLPCLALHAWLLGPRRVRAPRWRGFLPNQAEDSVPARPPKTLALTN